VQGRSTPEIERLLADAASLEDAGAVALVLEGIPRELAEQITAAAQIPTIGIGAGPACDGQILVFHDAFELAFTPAAKFVRSFGGGKALLREGIEQYIKAVKGRKFPSDAESYHLPREIASSVQVPLTPVSIAS
jgi:3-methyl-2-oxobutanoate hydroxymethyltransferase